MASEPENLGYASLNQALVDRFPQLREGYEDLRRLWGGKEPGPHIVFGDLVAPYIVSLLEESGSDPRLREVFAFLESLASNPTAKVQEVVAVSVVEPLNGQQSWRERARFFMGPKTLEMSQRMERAWGP